MVRAHCCGTRSPIAGAGLRRFADVHSTVELGLSLSSFCMTLFRGMFQMALRSRCPWAEPANPEARVFAVRQRILPGQRRRKQHVPHVLDDDAGRGELTAAPVSRCHAGLSEGYGRCGEFVTTMGRRAWGSGEANTVRFAGNRSGTLVPKVAGPLGARAAIKTDAPVLEGRPQVRPRRL